ncbi:hypothetical protein MUN77_01435 [Leucobacter allii]|uniref:cell wall-binding repeat-containing protein n=1 Tax=Leucobacter allii TaxID=2932247 RepID=UPI001FD2D3B2|nr:cell wall-binding repeat-containing protein [Leucobacter allii]UOR02021.1 hypothetical protein MUN77_01435 [Leucobacter allii]
MHPERVRGIADHVKRWAIPLGGIPAWAVESPSFASKGPGHDKVLSGWWMFVDHLMSAGWEPPLLVAPSQVKKFATGKGGGPGTGKVEVALAIAKKFPDVVVKNDNEADALVIASVAAAAHGEPFIGTLTKYQQEVVDAVRAGGKETP